MLPRCIHCASTMAVETILRLAAENDLLTNENKTLRLALHDAFFASERAAASDAWDTKTSRKSVARKNTA